MQRELIFNPPDIETRRRMVDPSNPDFNLNNFIGNEEAIRRLSRAVFSALGKKNRNCSDYSYALCGPASTGKTYLTKLFAEALGIPFVSVEPQSIKRTHDLFLEIERTCREFNEEISLFDYGNNSYHLPPMIVFIDEVHNLKKSVVQGLLKATEPNDRTMVTEEGFKVLTHKVCWMIATTDRGDLFDAFDTRFQKVNLRLYSTKEMAQIIKMNNPDWDDEICLIVAKYNSQVPREALAFARDMRVEQEMSGDPWEKVAEAVAKDHGIDEYGMTFARVEILKALGQNPVSAAQLPYVVHVKEDELRKFIMPPLMCRTPDREPLVTVSSRGYTITKAGLHELDSRFISNRGVDAMPEHMRGETEVIENAEKTAEKTNISELASAITELQNRIKEIKNLAS
jgi:Holliday junction resolvasome RuvABC ATP-dependent DNA helicase subunit